MEKQKSMLSALMKELSGRDYIHIPKTFTAMHDCLYIKKNIAR